MNRSRLLATCIALGAVVASAPAAGPEDLTPAQRRALLAIKNGDVPGLEAELNAGVDPNFLDWKGRPPLYWAFGHNQAGMVGVLARRGADVNWRDDNDNTYLHLAMLNDKPRVLEAFLDAGLDIDSPGSIDGEKKRIKMSPLALAAFEGKFDMVKLLAQRGANLNAVDAFKGTPVSRAWEGKHEEIARYLEGHGATDAYEVAKDKPVRIGQQRPPTPAATNGGTTGNDAGRSDTGRGGDRADAGNQRRPRAPQGSLFGARDAQPPIPPRPRRPIHEVTVGNVLGGPLSELWAAFSAKHSDWGLDSNGHITNLEGGLRMTGGSRIDSLPPEWAGELYAIGQEKGYVPTNRDAPFLVAPRGGTAQIAAQEDQIRQVEANEATRERDAAAERERERREQPEDETPASQSAGRPG